MLEDEDEETSGQAAHDGTCEATAHLLVFLTIVASNITLVLLHVWGLHVFAFLSSHYQHSSLGVVGDAVLISNLLLIGVIYVLEWHRLGELVWFIFFVASLLKGIKNPWASPACVSIWMLRTGLTIRDCYRSVKRTHFLLSAGLTFLLCGLLVLCGWFFICFGDAGMPTLQRIQDSVREMSQSQDAKPVFEYLHVDHARDCLQEGPSPDKLTEAIAQSHASCAKANNLIVIIWAIPFATACLDIVVGVFSLLTCLYFWRMSDNPTDDNIKQVARIFFLVNTLVLGGLYVSSYTLEVSASLTLPLLVSLLVAALAACKWVFLEKCALKGVTCAQHPCPLVKQFFKVKDSAWFQAMAVGSFFVPTFMLLERLRQSRRGEWQRLVPKEDHSPKNARTAITFVTMSFDHAAKWLFDNVRSWEPAPILIRICILGEIFFVLQVLGTKFTYVFLAWMNEVLADQQLVYAMALAFAVGLFLLLLPPVPGVPVYIFCGIVVARQSKEELSFVGGCAAAVMLSLVLKLVACTIQYFMGMGLGHLDSVQRFIGVGTPTTNSIMRILNRRFSVSKVAILVGGPDWPTSVACGILRVHLGWMLVGTLPCLLTASPCVLAGAFLADKGEGEADKVHDFLGSFFTLLAAVVQTASLLWATSAINTELASAGPATYEPVDNLSDDYESHYQEIIEWESLSTLMKVTLSAAAALILVTGYAFAGLNGVLFENFSVSGRISDDVDEFGLGGKPLAIVKPMGWLVILLCGVGVVLHLVFHLWTHRLAREAVDSEKPNGRFF